jgi:exonuclease SbcC
MNPVAIRAENYRAFERLELDLPSGCCAIVGENGAGKSSLVNVIDLALFGPESRSWAPYLRQGGESTELLVELVFEHRGETYRVRRGYSARGRGKATLDLERRNPEDVHGGEINFEKGTVSAHRSAAWDPLTRETIEATQAAIDELLGLSRETFRASAFLAQGDGAAFTEAQPRERKRILAEVLGLGIWDLLRERARLDKRAAEDELTKIAGALEGSESAVEAKPRFADAVIRATAEEADSKDRIRTLEEDVGKATEQMRAAAESQRAVETAELRLASAKAQQAAVAKTQREATLAEEERSRVQAELEVVRPQAEKIDGLKADLVRAREQTSLYEAAQRKREDAAAEAGRRRAEVDRRAAAANEMIERVDEINGLIERTMSAASPTCDRCEQALDTQAKAAALKSFEEEGGELAAKLREEQDWREAEAVVIGDLDAIAGTDIGDATIPDVALLERQIDEANDARVRAGAIVERIAALNRTIKAADGEAFAEQILAAERELVTAEGDVEVAVSAIADPARLAQLEVEAGLLAKALQSERDRHSAAVEARAKAEQMLAQIEEIEQRIAEALTKRRELQGELDLLAILERAYGRDGVPALIVSNVAIPQIEVEASRILAELGTSYRVELRTEKALAGGRTADALDVVVITEAGERPYETFSGGERTRLNLALRIALARLLAHRRGAESRLLAIDEPEFLDAAGTAALASVLRELESDFERIYLISHVPDLREAFEQTIEVVKDDDASRIAA